MNELNLLNQLHFAPPVFLGLMMRRTLAKSKFFV